MRILVVAPHPDDEVFGMGGTIALLADQGHHVTVATMTVGVPPLYSDDFVQKERAEQAKAHEILKVAANLYGDLPAAKVSEVPHSEVNDKCCQILKTHSPDWVFLPYAWDIHRDHRELFQSFMVALRPQGAGSQVKRIACYETVSETHWSAAIVEPAFNPQWSVDISAVLDRKLAAAREFGSQLKPFPHERSIETLEALARMRGSTVSVEAAEAFVIIRELGCRHVRSS